MYGEIPGDVYVYISRKSYTSLEFIIRNLIKFTKLTPAKSIIPLHTIYDFKLTHSISNSFNIFPSEDMWKSFEMKNVHFSKTTGMFP